MDVNGKLHTWLSASIYVRVPEWFTNTWDINKCFVLSEFHRAVDICTYEKKKRSILPPFSGWTQGLIIKQVTPCLSSACCCSQYSHVFNWQSCIRPVMLSAYFIPTHRHSLPVCEQNHIWERINPYKGKESNLPLRALGKPAALHHFQMMFLKLSGPWHFLRCS